MIRTRFAPSPTGYLHIGGVRTALFNWLYARQHHGQFILRIDDTDQQRNVDAALQPILDGFRWLGIDWDEGPEVGGPYEPYFQSQRLERYRAAVDELVRREAAYYDYATPEEIQEERESAEREKRPFVYSRRWMADNPAQRTAFEKQGRQAVVRLKMPREGTLTIDDLIRGPVQFEWSREQDHVIQRADGSCLYHLATVVDDHDLEISHVIRAEEHLSNTPRQIFLGQALGYTIPRFAHLPYVAEPGSRTKLSKRKLQKYLKHREFARLYEQGRAIAERLGLQIDADTFNPVIVDFYRQTGFLPEAIVNYLLLLGWSLDDRTEFFSREQMIEHFSLERVNKAPASFDPQKLVSFQAHYMQELPMEQKVQGVLPFLQSAGLLSSSLPRSQNEYVRQVVEAAGDRISMFGEILNFDDFFLATEDLTYDEAAFDKRLRRAPEAVQLLRQFRPVLAAICPFEAETLEDQLKAFVEQQGTTLGQIIHALRVAVTGKPVGFGMFETLAILGQPCCLERIDQALRRVDV